ncbi:MAG TPA: PASTA domain-containing protein, partial [Elusimicrobiales bacterium]|nr:PASTA domain-containing protein [Elusimicrobiales bacterium]
MNIIESLKTHFPAGAFFVNPRFVFRISGLALGLFLATYFLFSWTMDTVVHNRKEVIVPDIHGKSAASALQLVSESGLAMRIEGHEFNDSVPIDTVLRQTPDPGTTVREGKIIRVVFSQGGESVFTPNLIGLPLRNAELLLRQRQLLLGEVSEAYSLKAEKGTVLSQEPRSETSVSKNTMVQAVVAAGPPPAGIVLMPDFRQKKIEETYQWASDSKVEVKLTEDPASLFPGGTVIDQVPSPDTVVPSGSPVTLTVSSRRASAGKDDREFHIRYEVSQSGSQRHIRIVSVGKQGDREIFNGLREPGSKIDLVVPYGGADKVRIFVNGILVEEREVK